MVRSIAPRLAGVAAAAALLALVLAPAAQAKEGLEATLAAPISADAQPGDTVTVFFTLNRITETGTSPLRDSTASFRLFGPTGAMTQAVGVETATPGTYKASIVIPDGGAARAEFAIRGASTMTWPFTGVLVASKIPSPVDPGAGAGPVVPRPDVVAPKDAAERAPVPAGSTSAPAEPPALDLRVLAGAGVAILLAAAGAFVLRRRRLVRPTPA